MIFEPMGWRQRGERRSARGTGKRVPRPTGHVRYVIEGDMEIEFDDRVEKYRAGDGLVIPAGMMDRHRPKALSDRVRLVFVEDASVDASHDRRGT
jgi:quercetin dioxygenase-like cupin family protein